MAVGMFIPKISLGIGFLGTTAYPMVMKVHFASKFLMNWKDFVYFPCLVLHEMPEGSKCHRENVPQILHRCDDPIRYLQHDNIYLRSC